MFSVFIIGNRLSSTIPILSLRLLELIDNTLSGQRYAYDNFPSRQTSSPRLPALRRSTENYNASVGADRADNSESAEGIHN